MRLLRFFSTAVLLAASSMLVAEDVVLQADFAPGSTEAVGTVGTEFTVRVTLQRAEGGTNPGLTAYDVRMDFNPDVFEVIGYTPLVAYLPAEYVVAKPQPGVEPAATDGDMAYFHFTGADLAGSSTPANGEAAQALFDVELRTVGSVAYPLPITFMQNDRPSRDQGPTVAFGAGALTLPTSVAFDHSAFGVEPTPTVTPTATPTSTPIPAMVDSDRDGLTDDDETTRGTFLNDKDSDDDGFEDGVEVGIGTDPLDPNDPADKTDADDDGVPDSLDPDPTKKDTDGDGVLDMWEIATGFDPNDNTSVPPVGDANEDSNKDFTDAVAIFNLFLGNFDPDLYADPVYLDINRDGKLDSVDGVLMFNWYLGNIPYLPFVP
jgi:hypothetical protein